MNATKLVGVVAVIGVVGLAGVAGAAEGSDDNRLAGVEESLARIEALLEELVETSKANVIASIYETTVTRIGVVESRHAEIEKEERATLFAIEGVRGRLDDLSTTGMALTNDEKTEIASDLEQRAIEFEESLRDFRSAIAELEVELLSLEVQRSKLEEAIADLQ